MSILEELEMESFDKFFIPNVNTNTYKYPIMYLFYMLSPFVYLFIILLPKIYPNILFKMPKKKKDFIILYLDLETNGLNPYYDAILEIGMKTSKDEGQSLLINTNQIVSEKITQLTGITQDLLRKEGNDRIDVMNSFNKYIYSLGEKYNNVYIVGHNVESFDSKFLTYNLNVMDAKKELSRRSVFVNSKKGFKIKYLDTLHLARYVYPKIFNHRLGTLSRYLDIPNENHHRALNDAIVCEYLLNRMLMDSKFSTFKDLLDFYDFIHKTI